MSKKNVAYIKPQEPAFLARLKEEVGYKEGPTVDTKREALPRYNSDDSEGEDEQPVIVVVKPGDLSAEEAAQAKQEEVADLSKRVIFKRPTKKRRATGEEAAEGAAGEAKLSKKGSGGQETDSKNADKKPKTAKNQTKKPLPPQKKGPLSFAHDQDEDEC